MVKLNYLALVEHLRSLDGFSAKPGDPSNEEVAAKLEAAVGTLKDLPWAVLIQVVMAALSIFLKPDQIAKIKPIIDLILPLFQTA
jgi:hypothetical protein